eukprot:Sspe_Gene.72262::Locus_43083_Transcript_3_3_Confidence_0.500_Length_795::g.72262::m.72262
MSAEAVEGPEELACLLEGEEEATVLHVDGGDFGRPLSAEGVRQTFLRFPDGLRTHRGLEVVGEQSIVIHSGGNPAGHVRVVQVRGLEGCYISDLFTDRTTLVGIYYLFVCAAHRNKGYGSQLIARAKAWAREKGSSGLFVNVLEENTQGVGFYTKLGFRPSPVRIQKSG